MIQPNELRLGNLIQSEGEIFTVSEIKADFIEAGSLGIYPAGFELDYSIPLTEEWLKRFGFTKPLDWHSWRLTLDNSNDEQLKSSLQFGFTGCGYVQVCRAGINAYDAKCEYVHQLQNLYYALTSEELTLKEK